HTDVLFEDDANHACLHPVLWRRVEAHKANHPQTTIILVEHRKTDTAAIADLHLQIQPGTDIVLNYAIGRLLIENDDIDYHFIAHHTEGFEDYKTRVFERTITEAAHICCIPEYEIRQAATYIGESKSLLTMWTMGLN